MTTKFPPLPSTGLVDIAGLTFSYRGTQIFNRLSLTIPDNQVTVIMGPSGCGKSTLLALIGAQLSPDSGCIRFAQDDMHALCREKLYKIRKKMGMLFQHSALLSDLSAFENVAFPIRAHTRLHPLILRDMVLMKLEMVGLRGAADLYPSALSGGMARRIALARAIAMDPLLIMYDEPFTGLDPISRGVIVKLIGEINTYLNCTSIVVTHDVEEGMSIADYVYLLGTNGLIDHGNPSYMMNESKAESRQFLQGLPDGPVPYHYPTARTLQETLDNAD